MRTKSRASSRFFLFDMLAIIHRGQGRNSGDRKEESRRCLDRVGLSVRQRGKRAANTEDDFSAYSTNSSICRLRVYKKRYLYGERKAWATIGRLEAGNERKTLGYRSMVCVANGRRIGHASRCDFNHEFLIEKNTGDLDHLLIIRFCYE